MKRYNVLTSALILVVSLTISFTAFAGNPKGNAFVKGIITDKNTSHPVEYSSIALFDKDNNLVSYGTLTDSKGNFYLKNVPYGKYDLVAYQIGYYKKYVFNIELSKNNNNVNVGKLKLAENENENYYVEIIGKKGTKEFYSGNKDLKSMIINNNTNNL